MVKVTIFFHEGSSFDMVISPEFYYAIRGATNPEDEIEVIFAEGVKLIYRVKAVKYMFANGVEAAIRPLES